MRCSRQAGSLCRQRFRHLDPVDHDHMGVVERGQQPRPPVEADQPLGIFAEIIGSTLMATSRLRRTSRPPVDSAHPPGADLPQDLKVQQGAPGQVGRQDQLPSGSVILQNDLLPLKNDVIHPDESIRQTG